MPTALALVLALLAPSPPTDQTLVVLTTGWNVTLGRAWLVDRGRVVLGPFDVHVGRAGLGWGLGLHKAVSLRRAGPVKREGDQRSPAGVFAIGRTYTGRRSRQLFCVDDAKSSYYGQIARLRKGRKPAWSSAERMGDYRVAIVVDHNPEHRSGRGSCIFLHDGDTPTAGCTAFAQADLDALRKRLGPRARLVQLPDAVYMAYAEAWELPAPGLFGLVESRPE